MDQEINLDLDIIQNVDFSSWIVADIDTGCPTPDPVPPSGGGEVRSVTVNIRMLT